MEAYRRLIDQFVYAAAPKFEASPDDRFEVLSRTVVGTKQRRYGPIPSPEALVAVRDVLQQQAGDEPLRFFLPWGSRKQEPGAGIDVLEFMALKQLACLADDLDRLGYRAVFRFRVEDLTDRFLFGDTPDNRSQTEDYAGNFVRLAEALLPPGTVVRLESEMVGWDQFGNEAVKLTPVFYAYLRGETGVDALREIGWTGTIPPEQRAYYEAQYRIFYPGRDHLYEMARYFAATASRVRLHAVGAPTEANVLIAFTHPVPGNPVARPRVYYRTIPERYTNQHKSPWLARGYFEIDDQDNTRPRYIDYGQAVEVHEHQVKIGDAVFAAPFRLGN